MKKNKKEIIKEIMKNITATDKKEKKLKLYQSILQIDNTEREIVLQYLLLVKQIKGLNDKEPNPIMEIFTYINHFPPKQFNENFNDITEKKYSSLDKLLFFLKKVLSQNWLYTSFDERKQFIKFFNITIKDDSKGINNTNIITWENDELYIFNLYHEFLEQIKKKIVHYESQNINNSIKSKK